VPQADACRLVPEPGPQPARLRMTYNVNHRLLADAKQLLLDVRATRARSAADIQLECDPTAGCRALAGILQRASKIAAYQPWGTQVANRLPRLVDVVLNVLAHA